jgi:hypothetical protein
MYATSSAAASAVVANLIVAATAMASVSHLAAYQRCSPDVCWSASCVPACRKSRFVPAQPSEMPTASARSARTSSET